MLKIRRPLGRLIFNMGIAIPGKTVFLIETAPRALYDHNDIFSEWHYNVIKVLRQGHFVIVPQSRVSPIWANDWSTQVWTEFSIMFRSKGFCISPAWLHSLFCEMTPVYIYGQWQALGLAVSGFHWPLLIALRPTRVIFTTKRIASIIYDFHMSLGEFKSQFPLCVAMLYKCGKYHFRLFTYTSHHMIWVQYAARKINQIRIDNTPYLNKC